MERVNRAKTTVRSKNNDRPTIIILSDIVNPFFATTAQADDYNVAIYLNLNYRCRLSHSQLTVTRLAAFLHVVRLTVECIVQSVSFTRAELIDTGFVQR